MVLQAILEGLGLGALLVLVCAAAIAAALAGIMALLLHGETGEGKRMLFSEKFKGFAVAHPCREMTVDGARFATWSSVRRGGGRWCCSTAG